MEPKVLLSYLQLVIGAGSSIQTGLIPKPAMVLLQSGFPLIPVKIMSGAVTYCVTLNLSLET